MSAVLSSDFAIPGQWDMVGVLRDNMFELLCLTSNAPICHSVIL